MRRVARGLLAVAIVAALAVGGLQARAWLHDLAHPAGAQVSNGAGRLLQPGSNLRSAWWREAWHGFEAAPLKGTGAGSFAFTNLRYRKSNVDQATEPHDLPVQFLSETGVVGLVLFLVSMGWLVASGRRRPGPQLALALALPAYFLHGLVDIDWDFVSVSGPVFLIAGALAVRRAERRRPRSFTVLTAGGLLVAVAFSLFAVWLGNRWQAQADAAVMVNDAHAVALAHKVQTINPLTVEPLYTAADAELAIGNTIRAKHARRWHVSYLHANALALGFLKKATEVQPENADAWFRLGFLEFYPEYGIQPCARAAYDAFNRFNVLDGESGDNVYFAKALKLVNAGKAKC
jgi:hypothetical protein